MAMNRGVEPYSWAGVGKAIVVLAAIVIAASVTLMALQQDHEKDLRTRQACYERITMTAVVVAGAKSGATTDGANFARMMVPIMAECLTPTERNHLSEAITSKP
jgi:hypothetical protein